MYKKYDEIDDTNPMVFRSSNATCLRHEVSLQLHSVKHYDICGRKTKVTDGECVLESGNELKLTRKLSTKNI
jgi:hypothetical protein